MADAPICPACGSRSWNYIGQLTDEDQILKCDDCGHEGLEYIGPADAPECDHACATCRRCRCVCPD